MKTITTTTMSVRKADSSLDAMLNPVELSSKEIVSWGLAFPRPAARTPRHRPMWRTDATIGTVLGVVGRMTTAPRESAATGAVSDRESQACASR
jgi:hypothetical protein